MNKNSYIESGDCNVAKDADNNRCVGKGADDERLEAQLEDGRVDEPDLQTGHYKVGQQAVVDQRCGVSA